VKISNEQLQQGSNCKKGVAAIREHVLLSRLLAMLNSIIMIINVMFSYLCSVNFTK